MRSDHHSQPAPPPWLDYLNVYLVAPLTSLFVSNSPTAWHTSNRSGNGSGSSTGTDILTTVLLLTSLFIVFKVANYIRRLVMWWVFFFLKLAFLYGVMVVGWSVWVRGLDTTLRDVASVWGFVEGVLQWTGREFGGQGGSGPGMGGGGMGSGARGTYRSGNGYGFGEGRGREQIPLGTRRRGVWG